MVYFVATPIGNMKEITFRAVEVLQQVEAIFCEDTRHSLPLLKKYDIDKPLYSYHKYNEKGSLEFVLSQAQTKDIAVISDAGMPCVSDPGNLLVNALKQQEIPYTVVSGPSAFVNAFVLSGFSTPFTFAGFLPVKNIDRTRYIEGLDASHTLIFYMSVHDIERDRDFLLEKLGDRRVCLVKEISKLHEQARFSMLSEIQPDDKGEFVLVVEGKQPTANWESLDPLQHVNMLMEQGTDKNTAIKTVARLRGVSKNEIYQLTLEKNNQ